MRPSSPIRIVQLRLEALAPVAAPRLTYRGGPLLTSAEVFVFFWGDAWQGDAQAPLMRRVTDFFEYVTDIRAWQTRQLGGYTVQLGWSNRQGACA